MAHARRQVGEEGIMKASGLQTLKRRDRLRAANLCVDCGRKAPRKPIQRCDRCARKQGERVLRNRIGGQL